MTLPITPPPLLPPPPSSPPPPSPSTFVSTSSPHQPLPLPPPSHSFSPASSTSTLLLLIVLSSSVILLNFLLFLPQGLQSLLLLPPYSFSNFQYSIFFSAWTYPNIILPLIIGIFLDYKGITRGLAGGLGIAIVGGQVIILAGIVNHSFLLMTLGRFFFGIGLESIQLILRKIITIMFRPEDLIIGFGVYLFNMRMGNLLASGLSPVLVNFLHLPGTFLFALFLSLLSVLSFFASVYISQPSYFIELDPGVDFMQAPVVSDEVRRSDGTVASLFGLVEVRRLLRDFFRICPGFLYVFWLLTLLCISFYFGFASGANNFLVKGLDIEKEEAGAILMGFCAVLGICQPIMGKLMSHFGHTLYFLLLSSFLLFLSLLSLLLAYPSKQAPVFLISLFLFAILWSIISNFMFSFVPLAVPKHEFGLAYGLFQCTFNIGACLGPPVIGAIVDVTKMKMEGYFWCLLAQMGNVAGIAVVGGTMGWMGRKRVRSLLGK